MPIDTRQTERRWPGEFIASELDDWASRKSGTLEINAAHQPDGTILAMAGAVMVPWTTGNAAVGVLMGDTDSSQGRVSVAYVAGEATVKELGIVWPDDKDGAIQALADIHIVALSINGLPLTVEDGLSAPPDGFAYLVHAGVYVTHAGYYITVPQETP